MSTAVREAIEKLGKFENLQENHEGANAYAYVAHHKHLQETRFLKAIYLPQKEGDSVLREPQALIAALNAKPASKYIVRLHEAEIIKANGDNYILLQMEYLTGSSLQRLIETRIFGQQESIRIAIQILQGVAHMHGQRLLHRDLKPGNIIFHDETAKIADFGSVSKIAIGATSVTASKHSDLYLPPEGWGKPSCYSFVSDLYQIGLVLFQLINGPLPLDGHHYLTKTVLRRLQAAGKDYCKLDAYEMTRADQESFAELTAKEGLLSKAVALRPYYSLVIGKIIKRVTRAKMENRYASAQDFLHKLAKISTPDWKPEDDYFLAFGWKGWDWKVYQVKSKKSIRTIIERARPKSGSYRRFQDVSTLTVAFRFVEDQS